MRDAMSSQRGDRAHRPVRTSLRCFLPLLLLVAPAAWGADCDIGVHFGLRDTGTLIHSSCGTRIRAIFAKTITHDDNAVYGFRNNHYSYMLGVGYRLRFKRNYFDLGAVYIDRETRLFLQKQYAAWLKWNFAITPNFRCGYAHQSVPFVSDAGRNQLGCDFSFDF